MSNSSERYKRSSKPPVPVFRSKMADSKEPSRAADKLKRKDRVEPKLEHKIEPKIEPKNVPIVEAKSEPKAEPLPSPSPAPALNGDLMHDDFAQEKVLDTAEDFGKENGKHFENNFEEVKPEAVSDKESADSYRAPVPVPPTKPAPPPQQNNTNDNSTAVSAIMRGMEVLAETDVEENTEEIRRLDTQLDHLNECLDKFEVKIRENHTRIQGQLKEQKAARLQRRASFQQRLETNAAEDGDFSSSVEKMLNRCRQNRSSVVQFDPEIQNVLDQARNNRD